MAPQKLWGLMPNLFAYTMLFAWPVLILMTCRNRPLRPAILIALLGGFLLLPEKTEIDLPILPSYDKYLASIVAALLLVAAARSNRRIEIGPVSPGWLPSSKLFLLLTLGLLGGAVATGLTNSAPIAYGPTRLPGMTLYDALSSVQNTLILIFPLLLARRYFGDEEGQKLLLWGLVVALALYGILALWEVRMAPQLHRQIYGFMPHGFRQHVRDGHYRPIVFLKHGLVLSLLLSLAFLAALALSRILPGTRPRKHYIALAAYLFVVLVLSRSLGALALALLFAPIIFFGSTRLQILSAAIIAAMVLSYPLLRNHNQFLIDTVMSAAADISEERADSLNTRLKNEAALLEKGMQNPLFGWGSGNRGRVFDAEGNDITIADGFWIITFAQGGWVRYLSLFGLLCMPILLQATGRNRPGLDLTSAALAIILAVNLIDLVPNSGITPITWMLAGAMIGRLEQRAKQTDRPAAVGPALWGTAGSVLPVATTPSIRTAGTADTAQSPPPSATPRPRSPYAPVLKGHSDRSLHRTP